MCIRNVKSLRCGPGDPSCSLWSFVCTTVRLGSCVEVSLKRSWLIPNTIVGQQGEPQVLMGKWSHIPELYGTATFWPAPNCKQGDLKLPAGGQRCFYVDKEATP